MGKFHTVAFDLDGTLADPTGGLTCGFKYAFKKMGLPCPDGEGLKKYIGPPLRDSFQRDFGLTDEQSNECVRLFREFFAVYGWWDNELYEGIPELLCALKQGGKKILLATSKPQVFAEKILKLFDIDKYFDVVGAATLDKSRENKEQVLRFVLSEAGICDEDRSGVVLVGDTRFDVEGARRVGISSLGVLWGFGSRRELLSEGADGVVKTVDELKRILLD